MSLWNSLFNVEAQNAQQAAFQAVANLAPDAMGKAQIEDLKGKVMQAQQAVAEYAPKVQGAQHHVDELKSAIDLHIRALSMLADKPNADTDPAIGALFQKTKAETDDLKTQLTAAQTALDGATQHYQHLKDVADKGITALSTAQHDVDAAKDAQQAAKDALEDAKLRQHDAQVAAGLESSFDSVNPGLAALKAQTAKIQAQAAAASAMADGLSTHQPSNDVAALLAEAAKGPAVNTSGMSLKEQLAAMHG